MERRNFLLATGGALAGASLLSPGCANAPVRLAQHEADTLMRRLDRGLAAVRSGPSTHFSGRSRRNSDRLARLGLEALVVADVGRSVPQGAEIPPELAQRLTQESQVLARCVGAYSPMLAGLTPSARRNVERSLRQRPDAAMRVAEWIDEHAAEHAISHESRLRLRRLATDVAAKMRHQSMGAVIDETVGKVERVMAHQGKPIAFAREASANAMLASIWQALEEEVPPAPGSALSDPAQQQAPQHQAVEVPPEEVPQGGPGDTEIAVGGVMMGAGPVVFGLITLIGWAISQDAVIPMLIGATPGGTLVIVGLIILIVGVAQNG